MIKNRDAEFIEPSEISRNSLNQEIMESIFPIIKKIEENEEPQDRVRIILMAIKIGKSMEAKADKEFSLQHPDNNTHGHYVEIMDIVATCIAATICDAVNIKEYNPYSIAGQNIVAFANASRILAAAYALDNEMECSNDCLGFDIAEMLMSGQGKQP